MKFQCALIAVRDIEVSKRFYQDVFGLSIIEDYGINVAFTCGLALQQKFGWLAGLPEKSVVYRANNMELYFEEDDLDGLMKRLEGRPGLEFVHGIKTHDWQQRCVRIYDPDGHIIEIGEPMPAVVKRLLAQGMSEAETARITMQPPEMVRALAAEIAGA